MVKGAVGGQSGKPVWQELEVYESEHGLIIKGDTIKDNVFISRVPVQLCFGCMNTFGAYLVDDELWNRLPEELRDKMLCTDCLKDNLITEGGMK